MHQSKQRIISKKVALLKAQNLCASQEKCEFDIKSKLFDWGLNDTEIIEVIEELINNAFIDNLRYAKAFVREKSSVSKWGKIKIEFALKHKNIQPEYIRIAVQEIDESKYDLVLEKELIKKLKTFKTQDIYTIKSKLIRFGISRGYENGKVFDMVLKILKNQFSD